MSLIVLCQSEDSAMNAREFARTNGYPLVENQGLASTDLGYDFILRFTDDGVYLTDARHGKPVDVYVDFVKGAYAHRRHYGGGKGQAIAKAVGLSKGVKPHVLDATAGLAGDAFVLATLGCRVDMCERNPVVCQLLADGLERALIHAPQSDPELLAVLNRMTLESRDSIELLASEQSCDVVYLDPMFPETGKSAKVKKGMQAFHSLVGKDEDADRLLALAMNAARYRVVVKRPRIAPFLAEKAPNLQFEGKSSRFDIYTIKKMV